MLSLGIDASLAFCTARPSAAFVFGSPPPSFAATVIARASFVKSLPRRASTIAFLCLIDRKSTRLNSSHANISYAVFCLKKKKQSNKYSIINYMNITYNVTLFYDDQYHYIFV